MSYACINVIYGIPLTPELRAAVERSEANEPKDGEVDFFEEYEIHFEDLYCSGGETIGYCGVRIDEFDECADYININNGVMTYYDNEGSRIISVKPSPTQMEEAKKKIGNLSPETRKLCPDIGVYLIFSSS